ncbi:phosphoglycerate mutase family protein [Bifidobacterium actinocoloniiforme DSM 22766]|uniref:Phosphoglycerate mutase family protein n=1 Tax=Bifidobacterium actinocoloniiforme DSM 22766 TaxID=1437605 RepID=A0A086Z2C7_9BIFI|nr:histidine phosphatase family protein [Bifidobacterium actinocoloniiforme]KFI40677.1 phosphoglycerate mutase family protein [Bifidobacterium actinocoloniiforme DSM 22766]
MTTASQPVTIYLARHTQTTSNIMDIMQGWSDFPVTQEGRGIIRRLGRGMRGIEFSAAYCGTLPRHYETARGVLDGSGNEGVSIQMDPDLREDNFGSFEGHSTSGSMQAAIEHMGYKTMEEGEADRGSKVHLDIQDALYEMDQADVLKTTLAAQDRAETSAQVQERMNAAMTRIARKGEQEGWGNVLVISSGLSIRQFLYVVDHGTDFSDPTNATVTKLTYQDGAFTIHGRVCSSEYYDRGGEE